MNPILSEIPPSLIRALNAKKKPGDIDLGLGEPVLKPDVAPFEAATAWVREHGCPYTPNAGFTALRKAIADHYRYPGLDSSENVCVTVGSQEALYLAVKALCDPGCDEVLIVSPAYPAYAKICQMEGVKTRFVGLDPEAGFAPDASRVLAAIGPETRMILLASPANPTGRVWPKEELAKLAAGLADRPIYVLVDEVYRELIYTGEPYAAMAPLYTRTIVANSLSKSHALTGLRLGWLMAPAEVMGAIVKVHQFVNTAASTFSQQVALSVFQDPAGMGGHREIYRKKRERLLSLMTCHDLEFVVPEGSFYCMVRLPREWATDSIAIAHRLIDEAHVVTVPGAAFEAEGWLRLSWVAEDAALEEGIRRLAAFF
jgi:aminotransferase